MPTPKSKAIADALRDPATRVTVSNFSALNGLGNPGLYAWFVDRQGATQLKRGLGRPVRDGVIYAGQAGAGNSSATLGPELAGIIYAVTPVAPRSIHSRHDLARAASS